MPDATGVREEVLDAKQQRQFLNSCAPEFRPLAYAALLTGCRYGPMTRWRVKDFQPVNQCIRVGWDKRHKRDRLAPLTDESIAVFHHICTGRNGEEPLFVKANGKPWGRNHQLRPMGEGTKAMDIDVTFYNLRHTAITKLSEGQSSDQTIMSIAGHVSRQMLEHYSHIRLAAKRTALDSIATPLPTPTSGKPPVFHGDVHQNGNQIGITQNSAAGRLLN